ncbi:MAG: NADH-quinone oxidoreductase subunit NuoF, partial [Clostridia bacterium]|nr:NADH-quinone oxidoreductase subunit NuoF [Clostridia bacterium]
MSMIRNQILICGGGGCISSGSKEFYQELDRQINRFNLQDEIKVIVTGCMGLCSLGPLMMIYPEGIFYKQVKCDDIKEIVERHLYEGNVVERLLYTEPDTGNKLKTVVEIPFFNRQKKIALKNVGKIDPKQIEEYIAFDGYFGLARAINQMTAQKVIEEIKKSGLRGRGGAGFPTGIKWDLTAKAEDYIKYVVCNADEGDPGAFMDRSIIEGDPHALIEGMAIAGYAVGAKQGYIYIRAEYPLAVQRLSHAINQAREYGLLGKNIMNTGFDFDMDIRVGAGAFVCGEETALMSSVQGKRGEPRPKPPFPANKGLWEHPTLINNVETYVNVPAILLKGHQWFRSIGTKESPGTKVFALAGNVRNTGLVEVPMGTKLGDIIYDIGGGIIGDKPFKAAQTGGPSGGCIPKDALNVPVDYESLTELGTIMGSGGLIIMDDDTCMVDLAKFFLEFVQEESCGKCTPCRLGTKRMLEILDRITKGKGEKGDIEKLAKLGNEIRDTALCGLGQTAPNPVLNTIKYFRDEYQAHIDFNNCVASKCAALFNAPCQNACPAGVDVPRYIEYIQRKQFVKAVEVIRENNPFPTVCGRVCNHPCEFKCQRAGIDQAIAIKTLKRFVADYEFEHWSEIHQSQGKDVAQDKNKKIAVIGSGPAGLTASYYLARWGYRPVVFEQEKVLGGMLALTIPEYRLPKKVLNREIQYILSQGVDVITNMKVGSDLSFRDIRRNFDAVFIAIGSHKSLPLNILGENAKGVISAVDFLKDVNLGNPMQIGRKVVVVGGGNSAIDAARVAKRLGAQEVDILYRRTKKDMPAEKSEIVEAEREGIKIFTQVIPKKIFCDEDNRVIGMECCRMVLSDFDRSGRRKPVPEKGSEYRIDADTVLTAIGLFQDIEGLDETNSVRIGPTGKLLIDKGALKTSMQGVFVGGDCLRGPDTVIQAIADGKNAAYEIDKYLGGNQQQLDELQRYDRKYFAPLIERQTKRVDEKSMDIKQRQNNFKEVELSLS